MAQHATGRDFERVRPGSHAAKGIAKQDELGPFAYWLTQMLGGVKKDAMTIIPKSQLRRGFNAQKIGADIYRTLPKYFPEGVHEEDLLFLDKGDDLYLIHRDNLKDYAELTKEQTRPGSGRRAESPAPSPSEKEAGEAPAVD